MTTQQAPVTQPLKGAVPKHLGLTCSAFFFF